MRSRQGLFLLIGYFSEMYYNKDSVFVQEFPICKGGITVSKSPCHHSNSYHGDNFTLVGRTTAENRNG
jgi:hypothetical protein